MRGTLKSEISRVTGYKIIIQKISIFLYIKIGQSATNLKIPITMALKRINYLGVNLTKGVQNRQPE